MKKRVWIVLLIIFIIIIIRLVVIMLGNKQKTSVDDFRTIKELVEYNGHKYIEMKDSKETEFKKDVFIVFGKPAINNDGGTNQNLYEILIQHLSTKMLGNNYRIIDEEKDITVRIKFEGEKISSYTINNDKNFWRKVESDYQTSIYSQEKLTDFSITSQVLINIINNNWEYSNINLGTKDKTFVDYDIYYDEGYRIRTINSKIYNIVFDKNYTSQIINQITTNTKLENIEQILGKSSLKSDTEDIIGYKNRYIYVFFLNDEISVYPVEEYNETKNKRFARIVTELNKTGDVNTFLNRLTDIYPDYETYYKTDSYVNIKYPLKGFEVIIGANKNNGITIYNNYQGNITEEISIESIIKNKEMPVNVYAKFDQNLVLRAEEMRVAIDEARERPNDDVIQTETGEYVLAE